MTGPSGSEDRWVPRLTEDGAAGNPAVDLRRSSSANSEGIQQETRKQLPGLDVGGLIEEVPIGDHEAGDPLVPIREHDDSRK
jgi:hypothetical protein